MSAVQSVRRPNDYAAGGSTVVPPYGGGYPDILSAPAPVLRNSDILIDGETVDHLPPGVARQTSTSTAGTSSYYPHAATAAPAAPGAPYTYPRPTPYQAPVAAPPVAAAPLPPLEDDLSTIATQLDDDYQAQFAASTNNSAFAAAYTPQQQQHARPPTAAWTPATATIHEHAAPPLSHPQQQPWQGYAAAAAPPTRQAAPPSYQFIYSELQMAQRHTTPQQQYPQQQPQQPQRPTPYVTSYPQPPVSQAHFRQQPPPNYSNLAAADPDTFDMRSVRSESVRPPAPTVSSTAAAATTTAQTQPSQPQFPVPSAPYEEASQRLSSSHSQSNLYSLEHYYQQFPTTASSVSYRDDTHVNYGRSSRRAHEDDDSLYNYSSPTSTVQSATSTIKHMKQRRKTATFAAGMAGGVVGLVVLGPVGAVAGGFGGAVATRAVGKRLEKRAQRKLDQQLVFANSSSGTISAHQGSFS